MCAGHARRSAAQGGNCLNSSSTTTHDDPRWRALRRLTAALVALLLVILLAACGSSAAGREQAPRTWQLSGPLQAWDGDVWIVDAAPVLVPAEVRASAPPTLGGHVSASGTYDASGRRVANSVSIAAGSLPAATLPARSLDGVIEEIAGEDWSIAGTQVRAPAGTRITAQDSNVDALSAPGNLAHVDGYQLPSGELLAVSISLAPAAADTPPTATETPVNNAPTPTDAPAPATQPAQPAATQPPDDAQPPADSGDGGGDDGGGHGHDAHEPKPKKPKKPKHGD
jgi:hypothetical protein